MHKCKYEKIRRWIREHRFFSELSRSWHSLLVLAGASKKDIAPLKSQSLKCLLMIVTSPSLNWWAVNQAHSSSKDFKKLKELTEIPLIFKDRLGIANH